MTASCSSIRSGASASTSGRGLHLRFGCITCATHNRVAKYCEANELNKARGAGLRGTACDQTQKQHWDKLNSPIQRVTV